MKEEGRIIRTFISQEEVDATEEFLGNTSEMSLKEFYAKAFEEGKKAVLQSLSGNPVYIKDGITGEFQLLQDTSLALVREPEQENQNPHNITSMDDYRTNRNG